MIEPSASRGGRTPKAGFLKTVKPDEELAEIIGDEPLPRTDVTRKLWDYVCGRGLQDPRNQTLIRADGKLKRVLNGKCRVSMFQMTKLAFNHVT
jgi:chromatin remodeling complex protein RSC6